MRKSFWRLRDEYAAQSSHLLPPLPSAEMSTLLSPCTQAGKSLPHQRSALQQLSNKKLLLSIVGSDGQVQYAAIAMPESYAVNKLIPPYLQNPLLIGDDSLALRRLPTAKLS